MMPKDSQRSDLRQTAVYLLDTSRRHPRRSTTLTTVAAAGASIPAAAEAAGGLSQYLYPPPGGTTRSDESVRGRLLGREPSSSSLRRRHLRSATGCRSITDDSRALQRHDGRGERDRVAEHVVDRRAERVSELRRV